ncbi:organic solvent tolerance protein OstA [bacterium]|nr:organic solvent tolerance protein OstA [bacterium]
MFIFLIRAFMMKERIWKFVFVFGLLIYLGQIQSFSQTKLKVTQADSLYYDESLFGSEVQILLGNVIVDHMQTRMYCDTAYRFTVGDSIKAVSNIHIIHNDSIHIYGKTLDYNSRTGIAKLRNKVRMVNGNVVLTTDYLDFDRVNNVGYYFNTGKIVSQDNILTSDFGYYYPTLNKAVFQNDVEVDNPEYDMFSDTLRYNTFSEIVSILGPTFIVSPDNIIYSEDGYYNTKLDEALLKRNSYIQGEQILKGDTIFYNRNNGIGEVFSSMELHDTTNHTIITGDYGIYNEITGRALVTDSSLLMQIHAGDTLFMHADTLRSEPIDTTDFRLILAYNKVQFFRVDMQGRCDSMVFNSQDSTNTFYNEPIIWSKGNQMTADEIVMYLENGVFKRVELNTRAFIVSQVDTASYNQIKGRHMIGYISNNELSKIDVDGDGETIYYMVENGEVTGVDKATCSKLSVYLRQRAIYRISRLDIIEGKMNSHLLIPKEETLLKGFYWLEEFRPKKMEDIFFFEELIERDRGQTRSDFGLDDDEFTID